MTEGIIIADADINVEFSASKGVKPLSGAPPTLVIEVMGGNITSITSNVDGITVIVVDHDLTHDLAQPPNTQWEEEPVFAASVRVDSIDPDACDLISQDLGLV